VGAQGPKAESGGMKMQMSPGPSGGKM
jgi:hypothetical protein